MIAHKCGRAPGASARHTILAVTALILPVMVASLFANRAQVFFIVANVLLSEILVAEPSEPAEDHADIESELGSDLA